MHFFTFQGDSSLDNHHHIIITITIIVNTIITTTGVTIAITMIEFRQAPILEMALDRFTANYQGQAWAAAGFHCCSCVCCMREYVNRAS